MKALSSSIAVVTFALAACLNATASVDNSGTKLCSNPPTIEGPTFIMFDASYTLYTLNTTTDADYNYIVTRRDVTNAEIASLCSAGFDMRTLADGTVQGSYFPVALEFYNAAFDHYFVTTDAREISDLDTGVHPGWARTGQQFRTYVRDPTPSSGQFPLAPVCRYYGLPRFGLDTHFYSAFQHECDAVKANWPAPWDLETSNAFAAHLPDAVTGACPEDTRPLYRLYNQRADANHRYVTTAGVRDRMIAQGWVPEGFGPLGVAMCVRPG